MPILGGRDTKKVEKHWISVFKGGRGGQTPSLALLFFVFA